MILDANKREAGMVRFTFKAAHATHNYNRAVARNNRRRSSYWFNEIDRYERMALKAYGPIVVDENFL